MKEELSHPGFRKVDSIVVRIFKYVSYPSSVLLIVVAILATINVITSKTIKWMVPSNMDWITYLLIPIVFLSLAHVQLDRGLVVVDFLVSRYPKWLQKLIDIISNILLMLLNGFISYRAFVLMADKFKLKEMSSIDAGHFYIWPFCFLWGIGMLFFAFTSFWCILRAINGVAPNAPAPPEAVEEGSQGVTENDSLGGEVK